MSIKYKMIHRGDYLNPDEQKKTGYYPQIVRSRTVNTDWIALSMARGKRLNAIDIKGTIEMLLACIEEELLNGNSVCFEGFGTFALSAQCIRHVENPNEVRAESIKVKRVTFTPSLPLRKKLRGAVFEKTTN